MIHAMTVTVTVTVNRMILCYRTHKDRDECWEGPSDSRRTVGSSLLERKRTESYKYVYLLSFTTPPYTTLISDGKL
jgi:hypothetical protein